MNLPARMPGRDPPDRSSPPDAAPGVIAVVIDDDGVRDSIRFLFETAGYAVAAFGSAHDFRAEADPARFACLVLDEHLPGISGLDLLTLLRARAIGTPALLMVDGPAPAVSRRAATLGVLRVIEKPLDQDDLLVEVEIVLG